MYKSGDDKLEVRELLVKAFASAWEAGDKAVDRDTYINSSINVIDSLQVGPEMIYGEEGQGLLDDELDHLPDMCVPTARGSTTPCPQRTTSS